MVLEKQKGEKPLKQNRELLISSRSKWLESYYSLSFFQRNIRTFPSYKQISASQLDIRDL